MAKPIELESLAGWHISTACEQAAELAAAKNKPVHFTFNDTEVTAQPGESAQVLQARWTAAFEAAARAWRESPEYAERERKAAEELKQKMAASMKEPASTEKEMREAKVPWPYTKEQLTEYVESLVHKSHDYGTCVYAMSMAAEAAFNYVAHCLGVTGFQASCADLDFIRRTRHMDGPFILLKAEDALYPQYDLPAKLDEAMESWRPWLKEHAEKNLSKSEHAHPEVVKHWKELASFTSVVG